MVKKTNEGKELAVAATDAQLAALGQEFPVELGFTAVLLPRLGMVSQDQTEGKGKNMKVVAEAGTFFIERQNDEVDPETNQKGWDRTELGTDTEGVILYQRKQLKYYDEAKEEYTSSPVYDNEDEVLPLFCNKKEVARGTPAELRKLYPGTSKSSGKPISLLEDNKILYVLMKTEENPDGEVLQLNLRGSSMYSFKSYARKVLPPSVVTRFNSEAKEKGSIEWNMMTFEVARQLSKPEVDDVLERIATIKTDIEAVKAAFGGQPTEARGANESDEDVADRKKRLKEMDKDGKF